MEVDWTGVSKNLTELLPILFAGGVAMLVLTACAALLFVLYGHMRERWVRSHMPEIVDAEVARLRAEVEHYRSMLALEGKEHTAQIEGLEKRYAELRATAAAALQHTVQAVTTLTREVGP